MNPTDPFGPAFVSGLLNSGPKDRDTVEAVLRMVEYSDVEPAERAVLQAIRSIHSRGDDVSDPAQWASELSGESLDHAAYLADLAPDASRLRAHAKKLLERRRERRVVEIGQRIAESGGKMERSLLSELATELADHSTASRGGRYRLIPSSEIESRDPPKPLLGRTFTAGSLGMLLGQPGAGKSHTALDAACAVSTGVASVFGAVHEPGHAIYVAREGQSGYTLRLPAWRAINGVTEPIERLHFIEQPLAMNDPTDVGELIESVRANLEGPLRLVIVDTVRRCLDGSEKEIEDVSAFVDGCARLQETFGSTVIGCHHTLLSGERESGPWRGFLDTLVTLRAEGEGLGASISAKVEKQKDGTTGDTIRLRLAPALDSVAIVRADREMPLRQQILAHVRSKPGTSFGKMRDAIPGRDQDIHRETLKLLEERAIINLGSSTHYKLVAQADAPEMDMAS